MVDRNTDDVEGRRRSLATILGALGTLTLGGCTDGATGAAPEDLGAAMEELAGNGALKVADNAANLRSIRGGQPQWVAILYGMTTAGDGGGGVFNWSTTPKADDGWSVINFRSGTSAGWRRVNLGLLVVPNVTSLRALVGTERSVAVLAGYSTPGDGGGGVFIWDTTSVVDDGGTVFNAGGLNSSSSGWRRVHSEALNVKWFGAQGAGRPTDDDAPAINQALTAAAGKTLYFPPGIYRVTSSLQVRPNTQLRGDGCATTAIYQAGITMSGVDSFTGAYNLIELTESAGPTLLQNVLIEGLCFVGDNGPSPVNPGNVFRQPQASILPQVSAIYVPGKVGPSSDVTVRLCKFIALYGYVFRSGGGGERMFFNDNQCRYCGSVVFVTASDSQVNDNVLDTVGGIECTNQRVQICRNIVRNAGGAGIVMGDGTGFGTYTSEVDGATTVGNFGCMVTDNIVDSPRGVGILVVSPLVGAIIARNQVSRVPSEYHGISFSAPSGTPAPSFCMVEDNIIQSVKYIGIWCGSGGNNNVFRRNKITSNVIAGSGAPIIGIYIGPGASNGFVIEDNDVKSIGQDIILYATANCRLRGNKGTITLQGTGNSFIGEESGTVTVAGNTIPAAATVTLTLPRASAESYRIQITPARSSGTPAAGSNRILAVEKTATGFTVMLETAPGENASMSFDWTAVSDGVH
jgi:parallel beta-helix repeat protein